MTIQGNDLEIDFSVAEGDKLTDDLIDIDGVYHLNNDLEYVKIDYEQDYILTLIKGVLNVHRHKGFVEGNPEKISGYSLLPN